MKYIISLGKASLDLLCVICSSPSNLLPKLSLLVRIPYWKNQVSSQRKSFGTWGAGVNLSPPYKQNLYWGYPLKRWCCTAHELSHIQVTCFQYTWSNVFTISIKQICLLSHIKVPYFLLPLLGSREILRIFIVYWYFHAVSRIPWNITLFHVSMY